jgi:hypothetical protein
LTVTLALLWASIAVLIGTTAWTLLRTRGRLSLALLLPGVWLGMLVLPIALRPYMVSTGIFPEGYQGSPRDNLYISTSIANLALAAFQAMVASPVCVRAQGGLEAWGARRLGLDDDLRVLKTWYVVLLVVAVGLAILHWSLMPRVPALDVVFGYTGSLQPQIDRENAAKLLPAPALLRYAFTWNSRVLFPLLFTTAVLMRWRWAALCVGLFGLAYLMSPLEKFPATLFVLGPFAALVVVAGKAIWSRLMIVGLVASLLPALLISVGPSLSVSAHSALHFQISGQTSSANPTPTPANDVGTVPTPAPDRSPSAQQSFHLEVVPVVAKDLILRRIGTIPADVSYAWFSYFPTNHPFLDGDGWAPWNVLSRPLSDRPANMVALWAFYGRPGYSIASGSADGPVTADGWAEFGYLGVVISCVGLIGLGLLIELMRGLMRWPLCLACYTTAMVLFAFLPSQSGLMATAFSSGLFLVPLICVGYLSSLRIGRPQPLAKALVADRASG